MTGRFTLRPARWSWWYRKYAPGNTVLEGLEDKAREARKGVCGLGATPCVPVEVAEARQTSTSVKQCNTEVLLGNRSMDTQGDKAHPT